MRLLSSLTTGTPERGNLVKMENSRRYNPRQKIGRHFGLEAELFWTFVSRLTCWFKTAVTSHYHNKLAMFASQNNAKSLALAKPSLYQQKLGNSIVFRPSGRC